MNNLVHKWIVYVPPQSSPGDYYNTPANTIEDIVGIFKSEESAIDFCNKHLEEFLRIKMIVVEE